MWDLMVQKTFPDDRAAQCGAASAHLAPHEAGSRWDPAPVFWGPRPSRSCGAPRKVGTLNWKGDWSGGSGGLARNTKIQ